MSAYVEIPSENALFFAFYPLRYLRELNRRKLLYYFSLYIYNSHVLSLSLKFCISLLTEDLPFRVGLVTTFLLLFHRTIYLCYVRSWRIFLLNIKSSLTVLCFQHISVWANCLWLTGTWWETCSCVNHRFSACNVAAVFLLALKVDLFLVFGSFMMMPLRGLLWDYLVWGLLKFFCFLVYLCVCVFLFLMYVFLQVWEVFCHYFLNGF